MIAELLQARRDRARRRNCLLRRLFVVNVAGRWFLLVLREDVLRNGNAGQANNERGKNESWYFMDLSSLNCVLRLLSLVL